MYNIRFMPPAAKFIKKIKEKPLLEKIKSIISEISVDPYVGEAKAGDLLGLYCYDFKYHKTDYRVAYTLEEIDNEIIVVIMVGTRENFYNELKRYMG